jgi:hypothetical protein
MCKEKSKNQSPKERPIHDGQNKIDINKSWGDRGLERESPSPLSWQPIIDQTDPIPPEGGSGVGDSKEK